MVLRVVEIKGHFYTHLASLLNAAVLFLGVSLLKEHDLIRL